MPLTKLVCLDRDGTINYDPGYFGKNDEWIEQLQIYEGIAKGIKRLKEGPNVRVSVISNQAGIALGYFDWLKVKIINSEIARRLNLEGAVIDSWFFCPWVTKEYADKKRIKLRNWVDDEMASLLRKPSIGMIDLAAESLGLAKGQYEVYFFGDKIEDVQTGLNARGISILFDNGENKEAVAEVQAMRSQQDYQHRVFVTKSLVDVTELILTHNKQ